MYACVCVRVYVYVRMCARGRACTYMACTYMSIHPIMLRKSSKIEMLLCRCSESHNVITGTSYFACYVIFMMCSLRQDPD